MNTEEKVAYTQLEYKLRLAKEELTNITKASRFNRLYFEDDTQFADWAQSRARHTLAML